MAFIVADSTDHNYVVNIDLVDNPEEYDSFVKNKNTHGMQAGVAIPADIVPKNFVINGKRKPKHGFFGALIAIAVDDRVKDAIEVREPGKHRFHPVNITMKSGEPLDRPHFLLNCCEQVDAIASEQSEVQMGALIPETPPRIEYFSKPFPKPPTDVWFYNPLGTHRDLAVFRERIAGRTMWWDNRINRLFFSDDLAEALEEAGVEGFKQSPHVAEI